MGLWQSGLWQSGLWQAGGDPGNVCTISADLITMLGNIPASASGLIILESLPEEAEGGELVAGAELYATYNPETGVLTWPPIVQGVRVLIRINIAGYLKEVTVPDAATLTL